MRIAAFVFLVSVLVVGCSRGARKTVAAVPTQIKVAADQKRGSIEVFEDSIDPAMKAIVRLKLSGISWCTMTLVGPDIGVTAGHCFLAGNRAFDMTKDLPVDFAYVQFGPDSPESLGGISVKRVLAASMSPDYAIVRLNRSVPTELIQPAMVVPSDASTWRSIINNLACAGFAADPKRGLFGKTLTISRGIRIVSEDDMPMRIDTNCFANEGSSGGPLFIRNDSGVLELHGVVWGVTDVEYDDTGKLVPSEKIATSVTPVAIFADELKRHLVAY